MNASLQEMGLTSTSKSFEMWEETPIPMFIEVYFFTWKNAAEFQQRPQEVIPEFVELGPYVFRYRPSYQVINCVLIYILI
jgi:hypothetical protein